MNGDFLFSASSDNTIKVSVFSTVPHADTITGAVVWLCVAHNVCMYTCIWASEVSPTMGCSIEISHDIYMYIYYVCRFVYGKPIQKIRGCNYVAQTCACSKSVLGV